MANKNKQDEPLKVVVILKGGLVQGVHTNNPNVKIAVVDYDSEDWDETKEVGATVPNSACVSIQKPDSVKENLLHVFKVSNSDKKFEPYTSKQKEYVKNYLKKRQF